MNDITKKTFINKKLSTKNVNNFCYKHTNSQQNVDNFGQNRSKYQYFFDLFTYSHVYK